MQLKLDENTLRKGWSNKFDYWFDHNNYVVSNVSELPVGDGVESRSTYLISKGYIPYFTLSEDEVIKKFVSTMDNKKLKNIFLSLKGEELKDTFWKYFNAYKELGDKYFEFESKYLLEKAIQWCTENSVEYTK